MPTALAARLVQPLIADDPDHEPEARLRYEPHGLRKTAFAFAFLILLPFFASLPAMIYQRVMANIWLDTWGLLVIAVGFSLVMALILFELIYALRAEIELGDEAVRLVLPAGGPGAIPMVNYRTHRIPYANIKAIEERSEVYGGTFAPVLMQSIWIVTDQEQRILLGAVNARCTDSIFPFATIARQIAARAGVEVVDVGMVKRPIRDAVLGRKPTDPDLVVLGEDAVADVNRRHTNFVWALISVFVFLLGLGLATDMLSGSRDLGERSPNTALTLFGG